MYPRLKLAKNLLTDDGVIFISIDDNEQSNLEKICDEIFGEENFICKFTWQSKSGGAHDEQFIVKEMEYILLFAKNKNQVSLSKKQL
jgi:adenine-specific DNA-methyltransferase